MKKFLSLALTLALCLGLAVPAAAAAPDRFDGGWRSPVSENSWEAIRCTNAERAQEGLRPLSTFEGLHAAAQLRAVELKDRFDHTRPNGQSCMTALSDVGLDPYAFGRSGENIAVGYPSPASVVTGWMNSTGHRMNILTRPFCHIGLGSDGQRWVQMFVGICAPQLTGVTVGKSSYPLGTDLEDMEGVVALHCEHGDSYLPLSSEMCSGYDSAKAGSQNVTVRYMDQTASFTVTLGSGSQGGTSGVFADVPSGSYCWDAVAWAVENHITNGTSNTTFSPNGPCDRGQIVTFLWRANGSPEPASAVNPFVDVKSGDYCYKAVLWASEQGITSGTDATHFSPRTPCNRAQAVTFLWRTNGRPAGSGGFSDVADGQFYTEAVKWAVEKNITSGTSPTTFSPNQSCTRGQIVTFLYRDKQ